MTIKEKARKEYPSVNPYDYPATYNYNKAVEKGFIKGAKWMIDKAVEWFKNQEEETGIPWLDDYEIKLFRKAMEEE